ncbi:MAG: DUF6794 domain-containing protein [Pseudomonadota bacterium]
MKRAIFLTFVLVAGLSAGCKRNEPGDPAPAVPSEPAKSSEPSADKSAPSPKNEPAAEEASGARLPATIDEAVAFVLPQMSEEDKKTMRDTPKKDLIKYHHGFGTAIRNKLGLWSGNAELMKAAKANHPDDASMVIIEALWEKLQEE